MTQPNWTELEEKCRNCHACGLADTRHQVVVGVGSHEAEVMFIGEGPGENEDLQGEPFVGRGGKLLDLALATVGLSRNSNIYIANIVKCRPPQNRDPLPEEQEACIEWLRTQVRLLRPKIIVCLGRVAACRLINPDFKVTREHGQFVKKGDLWMMGTLHPAAVLRDPRKKGDWFADFVALRDKMAQVCDHTEFLSPPTP